MRTAAEPRAAWAEWAGWTCKERQRSLLPDAQRLAREDRKPPAGNCRGLFRFPGSEDFGANSRAIRTETAADWRIEPIYLVRNFRSRLCRVPSIAFRRVSGSWKGIFRENNNIRMGHIHSRIRCGRRHRRGAKRVFRVRRHLQTLGHRGRLYREYSDHGLPGWDCLRPRHGSSESP